MKFFKNTIFCLTILLVLAQSSRSMMVTNVRPSILLSMSQDMQEYLGYHSSSVQKYRNYNSNLITSNNPQLHLMGGTANSTDFILNGLSFRNPLTGICDISFSTALLPSAKIYEKNIPIEYSNANAAVIKLHTFHIIPKFHYSIDAHTDNIVGNKFEQNYYSGQLSGSLTKNNNLGYWIAAERKSLGDRQPSSLTSDINSENSDILPNNDLNSWEYHGRIHFKLSKLDFFQLTVDGVSEKWQEYVHYYNNPYYRTQIEHTPKYKDDTYGINVLYRHNFSSNSNYSFSIGQYNSEQIKGDGVLFDNLDAYERYDSTGVLIANPGVDQFGLFAEGQTVSSGEFFESLYDDYSHQKSSYMQYAANLKVTHNMYHTWKAGILFKEYSIRYYQEMNPSLTGYNPRSLIRYGFDAEGNISDAEGYKNLTKNPSVLSIHAGSELYINNNVMFDVGFRWDRFDLNTKALRNPASPFDPNQINPADNTIDETDLVEVDPYVKLNYKIGMYVYPCNGSELYISYDLNHQLPSYGAMYVDWDFFEARVASGFYYPFSNTNLEPVKSSKFSLGAKFEKNINKTEYQFYGSVTNIEYSKQLSLTHRTAVPFSYDYVSNIGESSYLGFNFGFQAIYKYLVGIFFDATISQAEAPIVSYTNNISWKNATNTSDKKNPLDYNQPIKLVIGGYLNITPTFKLTAIATEQSGFVYTPLMVYDAVTIYPVNLEPTGEINSVETDSYRVIDMKLEKTFKLSKRNLTAYVLIKNLLDKEIITGVYAGTGSPTSTGYLETPEGVTRSQDAATGAEFTSRYQFAQKNPLNFYAPRQIFFGLKLSL